MRWQRLTTFASLLFAWTVFAAWQVHEYGHERQRARQSQQRQAKTVMNALVGGIRSHRRLGHFFAEQLQGVLDELAKTEDVLAVTVASDDGRLTLTAGRTDLLETPTATVTGDYWEAAGLRHVERFELLPVTAGLHEGGGRGPGWGRMRRWASEHEQTQGSVWQGGRLAATLLLDRAEIDAQCRRAAWRCGLAIASGTLVLVCVAVVWWTTVRLVDARGRARVLESEARHLRDLSQAAAGLAHETRNPLGLVRGLTQQLAKSDLAAEQKRQAQAVVEECDRVTSRINQFMAFARPCEPQPGPVDVGRLIDELAMLLQPDLDAKNLKLKQTAPPPRCTIHADRELLRQAIFNLVQNAIQFAPAGGAVEIAVGGGQDGKCRIDVADRGPGVPPEAVRLLFSPYFTTRAGGTGLGLAIVRRIAGAHGWEASYHPRPGGGSLFRLDRIDG